MNNRLNKYKYPGAKRLMLEAQELKDNTEDYCAQPLDDNLFEWHFTVRGPPDTAFDGGYYHGRLSFPTEYPMKPPSIILLTPNGRFETNKKICLSISGYHPETWQPSWSVRTALLALIAFMPTKANRAIGSLDFSDAERRKLAKKSRTWRCETCGLIKELLVNPDDFKANSKDEARASTQPGTSRVQEGSTSSPVVQTDMKSSNSSDIEKSDSINNIQSSESAEETRIYDNQSEQSSSVSPNNRDQTPDANSDRTHSYHSPEEQNNHRVQGSISNIGQQDMAEARRAYPPLVLKSIFVLLSLLILRRVVMVIQA